MTTHRRTSLVPTVVVAGAIGLGTLMTVGAPYANASEKSDCDAKGGTYTETKIFDQTTGKTGTNYRCCVKDTATNTTSCTSTTVTDASRIPVTVRPGVITAAEDIEPSTPRVPLGVLRTDAQIQPAP